MSIIVKNDAKTIRGWAFYDWANSAYALVISTAVFPPYFSSLSPETLTIFGNPINSDSVYSFGVSLSFIILAFLVPLLSGVADASGRRMTFLKIFTIIGSLACMSLFFFASADSSLFGITSFIIGTIGFGAGIAFYNAYLPEIVTEDKYDKVSATGFAYGYIGSVILLIVILLIITYKDLLGISSETLPVRIGFLLVGVWWYGFATITFKALPNDSKTKIEKKYFGLGLIEVRDVFYKLLKDSNAVKFLASYFCYIAGVNVVIYLASVFAQQELGFEQSRLIVLVLLLQFLAMIGAFLFAYISKFLGNKNSLFIQLVIWVGICIATYYLVEENHFFIVSAFVGLVFGGIQSLSRSTYTKLLDKDESAVTSYFSLYDVLTKLAVFAGTLVFGLVNQLTGNMRYSILAITIFFVVGLLLLLSVKIDKPRAV